METLLSKERPALSMGLKSFLPASGKGLSNPSALLMANPGMNVIHVAGHRLDGV